MEQKTGLKFSIALKLILVVAVAELAIMLVFARIGVIKRFPIFEAFLDTLILSIFIIIAFYYLLNKPLKSILSSISAVQKGNLDVNAEINSMDEIGKLASAFNQMLRDLRESRAGLLVEKDYVESIIANMVESVIVIGPNGLIKTANKATLDLLGYKEEEFINQPVENFLEELEEEEMLNEIEESACLLSKDFRIIKVNEAFLKTVGLEKKDVINQPCYKITHNRYEICQPPYDKCPVKEVIEKDEPCAELHTHFDKEGREILVNAIAAPVRDKSGEVVYYLHLAKRVKQNIGRSQFEYEDLETIRKLTNKLEDYIKRLEYKQLLGEGALKKLNKLGSIKDLEMYYKTKLGEEIPVSFSGSVIKDKYKDLVGIVIVARDLRDIKRLEIQLSRSEKLSAIGQLAAGVAHEINNPLNVISGNVEILLMKGQNEEVTRAMKTIIDQTKCAAAITDRLLQFSKQREVKFERLNVNRILEDTLPLLGYQTKYKNITIIKQLTSGMPEVRGDFGQLQEVFLNIMLNAVQAMPNGGELTIRTYHKKIVEFGKRKTDVFRLGSNVVVIEFEDTGEGIPEERLEMIFNPFFSTKKDGTGLGLSICHGIIETHQGVIEVQSKVGRGTTFIVQLPAQREKGA